MFYFRLRWDIGRVCEKTLDEKLDENAIDALMFCIIYIIIVIERISGKEKW